MNYTMESFIGGSDAKLANPSGGRDESAERQVEHEGGQADSLSVHALAGGEAPSRRKQLQGSSASGPQSGAAAGSRRPEPYKIEKKGSSS